MKADFSPEQPNRVWCTGFTYMTLTNGTMRYHCSGIDLYDRSVVAGENSSFFTSSLAVRTLEKALSSAKAIPQNLILHSDQGSQFASAEFVQHCRKLGISQSMSRACCPYDNAPMERYYNPLKTELIYPYRFETAAEPVTIGTIRYAHTGITDTGLRLKRERSVALSSGVTKRLDHYKEYSAPL